RPWATRCSTASGSSFARRCSSRSDRRGCWGTVSRPCPCPRPEVSSGARGDLRSVEGHGLPTMPQQGRRRRTISNQGSEPSPVSQGGWPAPPRGPLTGDGYRVRRIVMVRTLVVLALLGGTGYVVYAWASSGPESPVDGAGKTVKDRGRREPPDKPLPP